MTNKVLMTVVLLLLTTALAVKCDGRIAWYKALWAGSPQCGAEREESNHHSVRTFSANSRNYYCDGCWSHYDPAVAANRERLGYAAFQVRRRLYVAPTIHERLKRADQVSSSEVTLCL